MSLHFHRPLRNMDVWSASSADISFVISFASPNGEGFRGRHGFLASWRPLYSGTGAIKVSGSPFSTFGEAEAACNTMLGVLDEVNKRGNRSQFNNRAHRFMVSVPGQVNQKHIADGQHYGDGEDIGEDHLDADLAAKHSGRYPLVRAAGLPRSKPGRTSAPRLPQAHVKRGSISESLISSGHLLALIATKWLQRKSLQ